MTEEEIQTIVERVMARLGTEVDPQAVNLGMFQVAPGQTILADHMNSALQTGVPKFASATARDAQWPAPPQGAMCYLMDMNFLQEFVPPATSPNGVPVWRPYGSMRQGYAQMGYGQVISNKVETNVKISAVGGVANQAGRATWTVNTDSVIVPWAGTYLVIADVYWPGGPDSERVIYLKRSTQGGPFNFNGVAGGAQEVNLSGGPTALRQTCVANMQCVAGDKIALSVYQGTGANMTLPSTGETSTMSVHLLGAD